MPGLIRFNNSENISILYESAYTRYLIPVHGRDNHDENDAKAGKDFFRDVFDAEKYISAIR